MSHEDSEEIIEFIEEEDEDDNHDLPPPPPPPPVEGNARVDTSADEEMEEIIEIYEDSDDDEESPTIVMKDVGVGVGVSSVTTVTTVSRSESENEKEKEKETRKEEESFRCFSPPMVSLPTPIPTPVQSQPHPQPPMIDFHVTVEQAHTIPIPVTVFAPIPTSTPTTEFIPSSDLPTSHYHHQHRHSGLAPVAAVTTTTTTTFDIDACPTGSNGSNGSTPYPRTVVSAYKNGAYSVCPTTILVVHPGPPTFDAADPMRALMNNLIRLMDIYQNHTLPEVLIVLCEHTGGKLPAPKSEAYKQLVQIASYLLTSCVSYVSNGLCRKHMYHHSAPITTPLAIPLHTVPGRMGCKEMRFAHVRTFIVMFGEGDHKIRLLTRTLAKMGYETGAASYVGVSMANDPFEYVTMLTRDEYKAVTGVGMAGSGVWHQKTSSSSSATVSSSTGTWASGRYGVDVTLPSLSTLGTSSSSLPQRRGGWAGSDQISGFINASEEEHTRYMDHAYLLAENTIGIMYVPSFMAYIPSYVHHIAYRIARDISGCLPSGTFQLYHQPLEVWVVGAGGIVKPRRFVFPPAPKKQGGGGSDSVRRGTNDGYSGQWYHSTQFSPRPPRDQPIVPLTPPVARSSSPSSSSSRHSGSRRPRHRSRSRSRSKSPAVGRGRKSTSSSSSSMSTQEKSSCIDDANTDKGLLDGHIPALIPFSQVGTLDDNIVNLNICSGPLSLFFTLYAHRKGHTTSPLQQYVLKHGGVPWTLVNGFYAQGKETIDTATGDTPLFTGFPCADCVKNPDLIARLYCCCGEHPV